MLHIETLHVNMLEENCHVVWDYTRQGVIIDCGAFSEADYRLVDDCVKRNGITLTHHLLTHAHYDHCFGVKYIFDTYGLAPEMHALEQPVYMGAGNEMFGSAMRERMQAGAVNTGNLFVEGDEITFGHTKLTVIATPGHTPGGVCFYDAHDKVAFVGDTIFFNSIGRTDFNGGDAQMLVHSIRTKLFSLPHDVQLMTGHGPATSVENEKYNNPYV